MENAVYGRPLLERIEWGVSSVDAQPLQQDSITIAHIINSCIALGLHSRIRQVQQTQVGANAGIREIEQQQGHSRVHASFV